MTRFFFVALVLPMTASVPAQDPAAVGSLFPSNGYASPLASRVAAKVGDVLTILVSETTAAQFAAQTTATKQDSNTVNPLQSAFVDWLGIGLLKSLTGTASNSANSSMAGAGSTTSSSRFTARVAARVKEVRPNGVLVIEAQRSVRVNQETQVISLLGTIRRDDVRPDNSVLSENIADLVVTSTGKGVVAERQRKGFLTRILDWLF